MTYCNPFEQFNVASMFASGNYLKNCLNQTFFGNLWGRFSGYFNQSFYDNATDYFMTPPTDDKSIFNSGGINYSPQFTMPSGFDTFTLCGNNNTNWGGFQNAFDWSGNFSGWGNYAFNAFNTSNKRANRVYTGTLADYNANKGKKLANISSEYTHYCADISGGNKRINKNKSKPSDGGGAWQGKCAAYVGLAIQDSGLGSYPYAHAYQLADKLRGNPNFKEISVSGTDWKNLPAGCILCYDKGSQGYNKDYGHTEITQGNGTATSDGTTHNIRKPDAIFIPV